MRRVYAMSHFVTLLRRNVGVIAACDIAAEAVRLGKKAHGMSGRPVHRWLAAYIEKNGQIEASGHVF